MTDQPETLTVLREMWNGDGVDISADEIEAACGINKPCRNMKHVQFEAENFQAGSNTGADLSQAWRDKLEREGKLGAGTSSLGDLVRSLVAKSA